MKHYKQRIGQRGEELAIKFLRQNGYKIIARNFSCRFGEIEESFRSTSQKRRNAISHIRASAIGTLRVPRRDGLHRAHVRRDMFDG